MTTTTIPSRPAWRASAAAAALIAATTGGAAAQEHQFTMAVLTAPGSYYATMIEQIPDRIAAATDGRVQVQLNDSVLNASQIVAGVRAGRVPMSVGVHTYLAGEEPRMGLFNLPGLMQGMDEWRAVGEAFWFDDLAEIWEERYGVIALANGAWCPNYLWSKEPIATVEDFAGKTFRVHNPQMAAFVDALGASPTAMAMTEVMPALERGVIDGVFTSWCVGWRQDYWRVANHVQNWGFADVTGWVVLMNRDAWAELPEDLQTAIRDAMDAFEDEALTGYDAFAYGMVDEMMNSDNVTVVEITEAERDRIFQPAYTQVVYDAWYARAAEVGFDGEAYIARVREVLGRPE